MQSMSTPNSRATPEDGQLLGGELHPEVCHAGDHCLQELSPEYQENYAVADLEAYNAEAAVEREDETRESDPDRGWREGSRLCEAAASQFGSL